MIRTFGLALAAIVALGAAPAMAQTKPAAPDLKIDAKQHEQGQKEAPAVAAASGVQCSVTDGYFVGESTQKGADGKEYKSKIYEVACKEGLGYALLTTPTGPAKHYDCISLLDGTSLRCRLPANIDPKVTLAPLATSAGKTCQISGVRPMGATPSGDTYYEVGCSDQLGFALKHGADGKNTAYECAQTLGTNLECKLTTKAQIDAKMNALIADVVAKSGKTCTVSGSRVVGTDSNSGSTFYEIACGATGGFMASVDKTGAFLKATDCGNASGIAGGCTLTDATVAETQEAATYTRLAKASGFPCQVTKYHYIGNDPKTNSEVVELACSNRPDGGVAVLPADNSAGLVYDCVRAGALGQTCKLSNPSVVYGKYTAALAAKGKSTCKVSNARWLGHSTTNNTDLIETACSDGLPGWVVEMDLAGQAKDVLSCGQARSAGLACTLPGNTK